MGVSREEIKKAYEAGEGTFKKLSEKYGISEGTIKSWAKRDKDEGQPWIKTNSKKVATKNGKVATKNNIEKVEKEAIADEVKEVLENTELTDKQKLFCIYYSKCFNQLRAYQKAYECSYEVAGKNAYRLMENEGVKKQIDQLTQITMNKEILKRGLLQKYIDIAFSDIKDYMTFGTETIETEKGEFEVSVVKLKDSSNVDGTLISEVTQGKDGIKIKLIDKMKALEFLTKHCNLLSDEEKTKLDIEYKKLQNEKAKEELAKIKGEDVKEFANDGFIEALSGKTAEVWNEE